MAIVDEVKKIILDNFRGKNSDEIAYTELLKIRHNLSPRQYKYYNDATKFLEADGLIEGGLRQSIVLTKKGIEQIY